MANSLTLVYDIIARDRASAAFASSGAAAESSAAKIGALGKALGVFLAIDIGAHAVKAAADFQKSTNVYVTAAGESRKGLDTVRQGILNVASSTGASVKGLTDAGYVLEKAGYRGADAANIMKAAAEGAAEENANLGTVTNAMTSIMASYHLKASDAVSVMNELKTAAGESKTNMEDFAGALSTVLPLASAAHVSFADVAGAFATLTQHGTSANEATQELAFTIRNLSAPSQVAQKEFAQLSGSTVQLNDVLAQKGLTGTLDYLSQLVLSKMGPSGKVLLNTFNQSKIAAADAEQEFNALPPAVQKIAKGFEDGTVSTTDYRKQVRALGGEQSALGMQFYTSYTNAHGFQQALKTGTPAAQTYNSAIKAMTGGAVGLNTTLQVTGANLAGTEERTRKIADAAKIAGTDVQGWASTQALLSTRVAIFKQNIDVLGIRLGTALLPAVTGVVTALGSAAGWMQRNTDVVKPLLQVVAGLTIAYYTGALALKAYEAASLRVTTVVNGLRDAYILMRAATLADYAQWGASALRLGGYAAVAAGVVLAIQRVGTASKEARSDVDRLTQGFDPNAPITYQDTLNKLNERLVELNGTSGKTSSGLAGIKWGQGASQVAKYSDETKLLQQQQQSLTKSLPQVNWAIGELGREFNLSSEDVTTLANRMHIDLSKGTADAVYQFRQLISTQTDYINQQSGMKAAFVEFNNSVRHLGENLAANRRDWSDNTDAGAKNWQTLTEISQQYADYAHQLQSAGPLTQDQTAKLNGMYTALLNTLGGLTGNTDQAKALLAQIGLFPPDKSVNFSFPGLNGGVADTATLLNNLRALGNTPPIHVSVVGSWQLGGGGIGPPSGNPFAPGGGIGPGHNADGGFITGPGGPRDDKIASFLSNGEFVVNAAATSRHRSLLEAINGRSGGSARGFASGGPVQAGTATFQVSAPKVDPKQFDAVFKAPIEAQKRNQAAINKAAQTAFVDPPNLALDKAHKAGNAFADTMPKDFVKRLDSHRPDVLKTQTTTFFDTADQTLNRTGAAAHQFADSMPKDFAKTVTSHTNDLQSAYKTTAGDTWQRTTDSMNVLADQTGKSVPAKIVQGFTNATSAVKAAADALLKLVQNPIDLLHGKTVQIVANTSITGVITAATGGLIRGPGGPREDAIPARLSDGEYVVNAAATKRHLPLLEHINAKGYADGGFVGLDQRGTGVSGLRESVVLDKLVDIATTKLSAEAQKRVDEFYKEVFANPGQGGDGASWPLILQYAYSHGIPHGAVTTTGGQHVAGSYHYLGEAVDFGNAAFPNQRQVFDVFSGIAGSLLELFWDPAGRFVKNGHWFPGAIGGHLDHVHVAASLAAMQRLLGIPVTAGVGGLPSASALPAQRYAASILGRFGWGQDQMASLIPLWNQESGWNPNAVNASSGAYGIPQALGKGHPYSLGDYVGQINWGLNYIRERYGSPAAAEAHERSAGWYANGGYPEVGRPFWVGERGPELLRLGPGASGSRVYSNEESKQLVGSGGQNGLHFHGPTYINDGIDLDIKLKQHDFWQQQTGGF